MKQRAYQALEAYLNGAISVFDNAAPNVDQQDVELCHLIHLARARVEQRLFGKEVSDDQCPEPQSELKSA
jgi:hypothetical protein